MKKKLAITNRILKIYDLLISIVLLIALLCHPVYSLAAEDMAATGQVNTDTLNVRSMPDKSSDAIGKLNRGDSVDITGIDDGWYRIEYNGKTGYVSADYVDISEISEVTETDDVRQDEETDEVFDDEVNPVPVETDYTMLLIIAAIMILLVIIIFATVKSIKKLSGEDDYDYDEYDDEEYDDDEYDDEEEYDDDYDDQYENDSHDEKVYDKPAHINKQTRKEPSRRESSYKKENSKTSDPAIYMSNNPDDYRIDIDPSYFEKTGALPGLDDAYLDDEDAPAPIGGSSAASGKQDKQAEIEAALKKMEELKAEIERIKNE